MTRVIGILALALSLTACSGASAAPTDILDIRLSDHRVAIGDFERLDITLQSVGVHPTAALRTEGWLEFTPQTVTLDLTQYLDGRQATILKTPLPTGNYNAVRLVVAGGEGQLKTGGTAFVTGFQQSAALRFTARNGQTTTILLDVLVEAADDHPGGGYSMNLLNASTKGDTRPIILVGGGLIVLITAIGGFGFVVIRRRRQVAMATPMKG
jgi:hypothetical protein